MTSGVRSGCLAYSVILAVYNLAASSIFTAVGLEVTRYSNFVTTKSTNSLTLLNCLGISSTARLKHPATAIAGAPRI